MRRTPRVLKTWSALVLRSGRGGGGYQPSHGFRADVVHHRAAHTSIPREQEQFVGTACPT